MGEKDSNKNDTCLFAFPTTNPAAHADTKQSVLSSRGVEMHCSHRVNSSQHQWFLTPFPPPPPLLAVVHTRILVAPLTKQTPKAKILSSAVVEIPVDKQCICDLPVYILLLTLSAIFLSSCSGRLWHRQPSSCAGSCRAQSVSCGAQEASRQEGRVQHRGAAGRGRLGGALPRQGARAELRPHAHEHSKSSGLVSLTACSSFLPQCADSSL